jgi:hypothetical protein
MDLYEPVLGSYLIPVYDIQCVKNSDSVRDCLVEAGRSKHVKEEQRPVEDTWNCL